MIQNMAGDRTWIYTSIAGSILGAVALAYLSTTRIGLWGYAKFDLAVDYLVERWGLTCNSLITSDADSVLRTKSS